MLDSDLTVAQRPVNIASRRLLSANLPSRSTQVHSSRVNLNDSRHDARTCRKLRLPGAVAWVVPALLVLGASPSVAQVATGPTEDAIVVPFGVLRAEFGGSWSSWRDRYSSAPDGSPLSERASLGAEFSGTPFGVMHDPSLLPVRDAVRTLTGNSALDVNLGSVITRADALSARTTFRMELGLGARLALLASVPYVQTRMSVSVDVDAAGANLGLNPALLAADAASRNFALTEAARTAADQMLALVEGCTADPGGAGCGPVAADPDDAAALVADANAVASALAALYGTDDEDGASFVPIAGGAEDALLAQRLTTLAQALAAYGIGTLAPDARPVGATPVTPGQFGLSGIGSAGQVERYGIGDVEVGAKFLVIDTFGSLPGATRPAGVALRLAVGGVFRYGRNSADSLNTPLDIGIGDGQNDLEGRAWLDVGFGSRVAVSLAGRYGVQQADEPEMAFPGMLPGVVERDLGDYIQLEASPRVAIGSSLALAGFWSMHRKEEDTFTGTLSGGDGFPVDAAALAIGTEAREQRAGAGIVFSTLDAYGRGRTSFPLDFSYLYTRTVSGAGRLTMHRAEHRIMGRFYLGLFGKG